MEFVSNPSCTPTASSKQSRAGCSNAPTGPVTCSRSIRTRSTTTTSRSCPCAECGKITEGVTAVDLDAGEVEYVCDDVDAGDQTIDGCGHEGTATLRQGKLPWRFEWPGQWQVLGVDFEPFGKDHAEGSWPSGKDVAENVLTSSRRPDGERGDSRSTATALLFLGNVITVDEVLDILEPEVFEYFFVKDPRKQRDFAVENIDQLVDEFDRFERRTSEKSRPARTTPNLRNEPIRWSWTTYANSGYGFPTHLRPCSG